MTEERFIELMEKDSGKWEGDNAFEGLLILKKYINNLIQGAEHDVIWSEDISILIEKGITQSIRFRCLPKNSTELILKYRTYE